MLKDDLANATSYNKSCLLMRLRCYAADSLVNGVKRTFWSVSQKSHRTLFVNIYTSRTRDNYHNYHQRMMMKK